MGEVYNFRCKYCGRFAQYGEFCSKECRHKWYIKYGTKDSDQKGMDKFF